ncbi:hypothetical protein NQ314_007047 [Rhamnusium bicolor]|uniref:Uncharacterized protein n=1 Tax=Rhamnusium bicolor TaxID=1586634 RepID=A0AAV8YVD9_9CUCU|nr:hypothetical protein NQ314_007047 [Rhamnusium bicolor]
MGKWRTMYPRDFTGSELDREKQDSTVCINCIPACSDTSYAIKSQTMDLFQNGYCVHLYFFNRYLVNTLSAESNIHFSHGYRIFK